MLGKDWTQHKGYFVHKPGKPNRYQLFKRGMKYVNFFRQSKEVEVLVSIAKEKKIFLISDEPYREYVFDGKQVSILSYMQEIPDYAILLDTVSKRWALCGARIGTFLSLNKALVCPHLLLFIHDCRLVRLCA